jgi:hypothetical protein
MGIGVGEVFEPDQLGFMVVEGMAGGPIFGSFSRLGGHGFEDVCGIWG